MGKTSKTTKASKALVKKRIAKMPVRDAGLTEVSDKKPISREGKVIPKRQSLSEISQMIASAPISRGKRKRAIKRARLEGRKAFANMALAVKKSADDVRGFGEALGNFQDMFNAIETCVEAGDPEPSNNIEACEVPKKKGGALKRRQKAKSDMVDIQRVNALFQIPEFSADPLSAIEKHLQNLKTKKEERLCSSNPSEMEVS